MKRSAGWSYQWIFYLTVCFLLGAVALRSLLTYWDSPVLSQLLGLLALWLILLAASETVLSLKWPQYFQLYLIPQIALVCVLLFKPELTEYDYFALLYAILSMQVMQRFSVQTGVVWMGVFFLLTALPIGMIEGLFQGLALALTYTAVNVFLGFYALATQRAQQARAQNQALAQELREANAQLQAYSTQFEQLAVARERSHLARDLHDSVTQTIFSMTLTTQSALLLLERDPSQVKAQLDRLNELAQSALAEMQVLISKLRPAQVAEGGLEAALRRHLAERHLPEGLAVALELESDPLARLTPAEEQSLFRIAQEALNNTVKHAGASQAYIRLHLVEPLWMEIEDNGQGFDLKQTEQARERIAGGQVGLVSMGERAAEIGCKLQIVTSAGAGTRIRVERSTAGRSS